MNNYLYANGILSALETKILDRSKLYVLSGLPKDEFIKTLTSMNYGTFSNSIFDVIESENKKTKDLFLEITPNKQDTDLFFLVNDTEVIKVLYKAKIYNVDLLDDDLMQSYTTTCYKTLKEAVFSANMEGLNKHLVNVLTKIEGVITPHISPSQISSFIDSVMYEYARSATKDNVLKKYLKLKIDLTNIEIYFRCKKLGFKETSLDETLLSGGLINKSIFVDNYEDTSRFVKGIAVYYDEKLTKTISPLLQDNKINNLSIKLMGLMKELISEHKNDIDTIGPFINYYIKKEIEAQNIKLLYKFKDISINELL